MNPADAISAARSRLSVPADFNHDELRHLADLFLESCDKYADEPMVTSLGNTLTYAQVREGAEQFASFLQHHTRLKPGDRVALQMPNVTQYQIAFYGTLMAGMVVVNTNPLYTAKELKHQFNDSGAKLLVVLENVAHTVAEVLPETGIEQVVITQVADMHALLSRTLTHFVVKRIKKMVPAYSIANSLSWRDSLKLGSQQSYLAPAIALADCAILQCTVGMT
ncbi:AMP-binding protein [bacterium]|nr:AMP-binding protein [bacterium]